MPIDLTWPPITTVGSSRAASKMTPHMLVVVVLPCDPATPTPNLRRISSAKTSARRTIGIFLRFASRTSGFELVTAEE